MWLIMPEQSACVLETLADGDAKHVVSAMQNGPFAEGSNGVRAVILYSLCVCYFEISYVVGYIVIKRMHEGKNITF